MKYTNVLLIAVFIAMQAANVFFGPILALFIGIAGLIVALPAIFKIFKDQP